MSHDQNFKNLILDHPRAVLHPPAGALLFALGRNVQHRAGGAGGDLPAWWRSA